MTETQIKYIENGQDIIRHDGIIRNVETDLTNFIIRLSKKGIVNLKNINERITDEIVKKIDEKTDDLIKVMR